MKILEKSFIAKNKKQQIVENEKQIMTSLNHTFIVKLHYCFETKDYLIFVMEFCSGGELFYQLK